MKKLLVIASLLVSFSITSLAEGPGGPPQTPIDGGSIYFIITTVIAGAIFLAFRKKKN